MRRNVVRPSKAVRHKTNVWPKRSWRIFLALMFEAHLWKDLQLFFYQSFCCTRFSLVSSQYKMCLVIFIKPLLYTFKATMLNIVNVGNNKISSDFSLKMLGIELGQQGPEEYHHAPWRISLVFLKPSASSASPRLGYNKWQVWTLCAFNSPSGSWKVSLNWFQAHGA